MSNFDTLVGTLQKAHSCLIMDGCKPRVAAQVLDLAIEDGEIFNQLVEYIGCPSGHVRDKLMDGLEYEVTLHIAVFGQIPSKQWLLGWTTNTLRG